MSDRSDEMVPILRVADAERAAQWYARLGFVLEGVHRFEPGFPAYAFIRRNATYVHLSEHRGDAPPHGVVYWYVDRSMLEYFGAAAGAQCGRVLFSDHEEDAMAFAAWNARENLTAEDLARCTFRTGDWRTSNCRTFPSASGRVTMAVSALI